MDPRKQCCAVLLNKPVYQPGDVVEGLACLNLQEACECRGLFIKFKGYEQCLYQEPYEDIEVIRRMDGSKTVHKVTKYREHKGRLTYFDRQVCVAGPGAYQAGQYTVPFILPLPQEMHPSCHYDNTGFVVKGGKAQQSSGGVYYKLKATLFKKGALKANVVGYAPVTVEVDQAGAQRHFNETTDIVTCGCFCKAPAGAKVLLASNVLHSGAPLKFTVDADNGSSHPFTRIQVRLMRSVAFVDNPSASSYQIKFSHEVTSKTFPGYTKLEPRGQRVCEMALPALPCVSVSTDVFEASYWAEVSLRTGMASNLVVRMPLTIKLYPTERLGEESRPAAIQGWCPMQTHHEPVLLSVPSSPAVPAELLVSEDHFWNSWASSPLVPGCIPPPPEVGYEVCEDELNGASSNGFDPNGGGMAKKKSRAVPGAAPSAAPAPAPVPATKGGISRLSNGSNGDAALAPVTPTRLSAA